MCIQTYFYMNKLQDKKQQPNRKLKTFDDGLPRSVRGQSEEMRIAIRRRQNSESARKSHRRNKEQHEDMESKYQQNAVRMQALEKKVEELLGELLQ